MNYKKQGLFELKSRLPFGKHKGKTIMDVYTGNSINLITRFISLLHESLNLIFSADTYKSASDPSIVDISWIGGIDHERINEQKLQKLALALHSGDAWCDYKLTSKKIKINVYSANQGGLDKELSQIACEVAQEYMTRSFVSINVMNSYEPLVLRPDILTHQDLTEYEESIIDAEGTPSYIYWCIRKVDGFCLEGNNTSIKILDTIPFFSFDSIKTKVGKIKRSTSNKIPKLEFSFKFWVSVEAQFAKASTEVVQINFNKLSQNLKIRNQIHILPDEANHDSSNNEHYDNDNDEDNIMRGLDSGDGDLMGF